MILPDRETLTILAAFDSAGDGVGLGGGGAAAGDGVGLEGGGAAELEAELTSVGVALGGRV